MRILQACLWRLEGGEVMGYYLGGEYFQTPQEMEPACDAGICYDPECSGKLDTCENCGRYIGVEKFNRFNGFCEDCHREMFSL